MFDIVLRMSLQRSFEDLGTPLAEVTFCVVDLETTGGSPTGSAITEVGACKVRCGEVVGTFQTLVNPGQPVPAFVRLLTGLSDDLLVEAPAIETVLPSLLEFTRGTVLVAHNARFDVGFINAALERTNYDPLDNRVLDTAVLARKILAGEVPNHKLETLARYLRCAHQPTHRAYKDVLATVDVLHHLIERVAGFGVTTLEDLVAMSASRIDGTFSKIRLTDDVPSASGVYRFLSAGGDTLYVGKATDLRSRVRSYFYGDPRRKIRDLLRQVDRIEVETFETMLEAEVAEARAIAAEKPPHNRAGKRSATWYMKIHVAAKVPKLATARVARDDDHLYIGPFTSIRTVKTLIEALRDATRVHRCTEPARCGGCAFSQMGRCAGPDRAQHADEVRAITAAVTGDPERIFLALETRMKRLAAAERFEEAAEARERAASLEHALAARIGVDTLISAGDVVLRVGSRVLLVRNGRLSGAVSLSDRIRLPEALRLLTGMARAAADPAFVTDALQREARVISSWINRNAAGCDLISVSGTWALPIHAGRLGGRFKKGEGVGDEPARRRDRHTAPARMSPSLASG